MTLTRVVPGLRRGRTMAKSTYSYGPESPVKFELSDSLVESYNEAIVKFLKAQQRFNQKFGRQWDPIKDPIKIKWSSKQAQAYNKVARIVNAYIDKHGPIETGEYMDDFLIKNTASAAISVVKNGGRLITTAAMIGALYVLLRGLQRHA